MSPCRSSPSISQQRLVAPTTDTLYVWFTGWRSTLGVQNARLTTKRRAVTGNFQCRPCLQAAMVRGDVPDAPTLLDTQMRAGAGETCTAADVGGALVGRTLVRYGVAYSVSSGNLGQADVELAVVDDGCGEQIGQASVVLSALSTTDSYYVLTGWVPALLAAKVKAALVTSGIVGNFRFRLAYRKATTSTQAPGAWTTTWDAWRSAEEEVNTGELDVDAADSMWVQFAIQYALSSGSSLGSATISVGLGARKG